MCVDALSPQLGGIGRYTWELCRRLPSHPALGPVRYYARNRYVEDPSVLLASEILPRPRPLARIYRRLANGLRSHRGIVHAPNYFLPDAFERGVITVHDLSVFRYPETHPEVRVEAFERDFSRSLARASHVITDTETVRREVIEAFGLQEQMVTAVPLGIGSDFRSRSPDELAGQLAELGLAPGGYGLCVSTFEPRKKAAELIKAWNLLPAPLRNRFPLVLAGGVGWRNEELLGAVDRGVAEGWLRNLGFVEERLLPSLYSGAALFLYPSIYEGFGLPPVEAMASGVPVVISNRSCLPEVCGDAARQVDPDDIEAMALTIEQCLVDEGWREAAVRRGLERARLYTWERCVEKTVAVYRSVSSAN